MTDTLTLKVQHTSLEHSDNAKQQEHDIELLFAMGQDFPIKTGTEAGKDADGHNQNRELLQEYADQHGHYLAFGRDNWIAVDKKIVVPGSFVKDQVFVASHDELRKTHGQDRVFATVRFDHVEEGVGTISQAAAHYSTKGAVQGDPNFEINQRYAKKLHEWMVEQGKGRDLAFVNGDFNMNDRKLDWAFGGHFTSMADELNAWQNSGHGPIDGFASYDKDGRVKAKWFRVLDDKDKFLFTDHFMCRGAWDISLIPNR